MDEDEYGLSVAVWFPDAPKVEVRLTWAEPMLRGLLIEAAADLAGKVLDISKSMAEQSDG